MIIYNCQKAEGSKKKMDFQIKKVEGYSEILNKLVKLMEEGKTTITYMREYNNFVTLNLDTSFKSKIGAYLAEEHYPKGDYGIRIHDRVTCKNIMFIPIAFIDTIWRL